MTMPGAAKIPKPARKSRRPIRGALTLIGGLLVASALLRVVIGAGEAMAKNGPEAMMPSSDTEAMHDQQGAASDSTMDMAGANAGDAPVERVAEDEIMPLIEALNAREARVVRREQEIEMRMQALSVAEQEIDRKLVALEDAEAKLRGTLTLARTAAEDDISRLTDVYANMKPKQAAALFEEMDPDFAAGFLARMRPDTAAAIMAGLTPGAAYTISVVLAGRNADVPTE